MRRKICRVGSIAIAAAVLLSLSLGYSHMESEQQTCVDLSAAIDRLSSDANFEYSFISADQLRQGTVVWQQPIPSRVRDIWGLGTDNLLFVCEENCPSPSPYVKPRVETIFIIDPDGTPLAEESIGEFSVRGVHQSRDGSLVSIETTHDHEIINMITDCNGSGFLRIGYHSVLIPSWDGEYLVNTSSRKTGKTSVLILNAGGVDRKIPATRFISKDGSPKETGSGLDFPEESKRVLGAFCGGELLSFGCDSAGFDCTLALYNAGQEHAIWTRESMPLTSLDAVSGDAENLQKYLLLKSAANKRGVQSYVISKEDGNILGESFGAGALHSIGSNDGHFYSVFAENSPPGQRPKHKFILKYTPRFNIASYGTLCGYHSIISMKLHGDWVYGYFDDCTIDGKVISRTTALFNMGIDGRVKPTILEGTWYISSATENGLELIGQVDSGEGYIMRLSLPKSWLE